MFANTKATNGFAVDDIEAAKQFYGETLGLGVKVLSEEFGVTSIQLAGGRDTLVYAKPDFVPATYTILNFEVDDVDAAVDELAAQGRRASSATRASSRTRRASPAARVPHRLVQGPGGQHPLGAAAALLAERRSGVEQLGLLGGELLLGEDPLGFQLAELLELVDHRLRRRGGCGSRSGGGRRLPAALLPAVPNAGPGGARRGCSPWWRFRR